MYHPQQQQQQQPHIQNLSTVVGQTGNGTVAHTNGGNSMFQPYVQPNIAYPIHPEVRLKKLAFFDVMATLLKPSTLLPVNSQRIQEGTYYFHLTTQQATDIASNRDVRNSSKVEHVIQVQLRFCVLETTCDQEDNFPPNVVVKVNNKLCALPNPTPTNKPNVEPKRPPRPVNITTNVKLSPTVANNISVSWCTEYNRAYVVAAYLVKKLSSAQLLNRMKTKGVRSADFTRGLIREKLNEDADCDIATTMLKVSLVCPLGKMRMTTPCRASTCSHLQCFDASLYLQMNERKPTWSCPVCDKPAIYENLVIDGYFQDVLSSSNLSSDTNEIQLNKDGSWSTHVLNNDSQCLDTPSKRYSKVEVISDDLEIVDAEPPIKNSVFSSNEPTSTTAGIETSVDLTLSDSDDEQPLKSKAAPTAVLAAAPSSSNTSSSTVSSKSSDSNSSSSAILSTAATTLPQQQTGAVSSAAAAAAAVVETAAAAQAASYKANDISIITLDTPSPPNSPASSRSNNSSGYMSQQIIDPIFVATNNISTTTTSQHNMSSIASTFNSHSPGSNSSLSSPVVVPFSLNRFDGDPLESQIASLTQQGIIQQQRSGWLPTFTESGAEDQNRLKY